MTGTAKPCDHENASPIHEDASGGTWDFCQMACPCGLKGKSWGYHMQDSQGKQNAEIEAVAWWRENVAASSTELRALRERVRALEAPKDSAWLEQAWREVQGVMLDNMLNTSQRRTFILSILNGQLANPPKYTGYNAPEGQR